MYRNTFFIKLHYPIISVFFGIDYLKDWLHAILDKSLTLRKSDRYALKWQDYESEGLYIKSRNLSYFYVTLRRIALRQKGIRLALDVDKFKEDPNLRLRVQLSKYIYNGVFLNDFPLPMCHYF